MLYVCLYAADICTCLCWVWASQLVVAVKNSPTNAGGLGSIPGSRRPPWRRAWQATPLFLPGEFHGQQSLVGYSPWGCKELDMTKVTYHAFRCYVEKYIQYIQCLMLCVHFKSMRLTFYSMQY